MTTTHPSTTPATTATTAQPVKVPDAAVRPGAARSPEEAAAPQGSVTSPAPGIGERFRAVRALTEQLASRLSPEDQTPQSMTEASPTKWHRAHTTWFFEEFVLGGTPGYQPVDPAYRFLFNSYYEQVGARQPRPSRGLVTRPGVKEIGRYRATVDERVDAALGAGRLDEAALTLVELGCHHEEQHQELLLMDAKHLLSHNVIDPVYVDRPADDLGAVASPLEWRAVAGGVHEIGAGEEGFAFDNERPRHRVYLEPFELASRPVTNAEWLEFIADGGYARAELWLSDGWGTLGLEGWQAPGYWRPEPDGSWSTYTLSGRRPVVPAEPVVHVSFYEADAYARWAGARLPTEAEWEVAAAARPEVVGGLLDPSRVHPGVARATTYGDVWEWTASAYLPYPGFAPAAGAVGEYNGKFMCDQHVLRGGCAATPVGHTRITYRNFYPAASRWTFSGLRLAR